MQSKQPTQRLQTILKYAIDNHVSDVHINIGVPPVVRIDGHLRSVPSQPVYDEVAVNEDVMSVLPENVAIDRPTVDIDYAFGFGGYRIRANVFHTRGHLAASYRLISNQVKQPEELGLPPIITGLSDYKQGLVIVTGPTGHGKTTTIAGLIEHVNQTRSENIITIEDPIEYIFTNNKSIISQREVGKDTESFNSALNSAFRQDTDVVFLGELRDTESIKTALVLAESGHLVFTTLQATSAPQTADRIVHSFLPHKHQQVRTQLAAVLVGIVGQRLIPRVHGGRVIATEILIANNAVKSTIREGKTYQIDNIIQTSAPEGMISLESSLANLVNQGEVSIDDAEAWANDKKRLKMNIY